MITTEVTKADIILGKITSIRRANDQMMLNVANLFQEVQCKELQNVIMDLESIDQHLAGLTENGPTAPYVEVEPIVVAEDDFTRTEEFTVN
jgi:hypothetical protein